jgi:transcriptional regulator with XRE-family HTH domain
MAREQRAGEWGRTWAATIAANIRRERRIREWAQPDVAARMGLLGYPWIQRTVSDVERHNRDLTVDEVGALAVVFGVPFAELVDPRGPDRQESAEPFVGLGNVTVSQAAEWLAGERTIRVVQDNDGKLRLENKGPNA